MFDSSYGYTKTLVYAIAAVCGLVAGLRVYNQWQIHGRQFVHIDAKVIAWLAAAMFLCIAMAMIDKLSDIF